MHIKSPSNYFKSNAFFLNIPLTDNPNMLRKVFLLTNISASHLSIYAPLGGSFKYCFKSIFIKRNYILNFDYCKNDIINESIVSYN